MRSCRGQNATPSLGMEAPAGTAYMAMKAAPCQEGRALLVVFPEAVAGHMINESLKAARKVAQLKLSWGERHLLQLWS